MRLLLIEPKTARANRLKRLLQTYSFVDLAHTEQEASSLLRSISYDAVALSDARMLSSLHRLQIPPLQILLPEDIDTFFAGFSSLPFLSVKTSIRYKDLLLFPDTQTISWKGKMLFLRRKEFQLLSTFLRFPQRVLSKTFLKQKAWQDWSVSNNTIESQIRNLRQKLSLCKAGISLRTVYGRGYTLE